MKKLNTWTIKRHHYVLESKTYDEPKTEEQLKQLASDFVKEHNIYDYELRYEFSYKEEKK